MLALIPVSGIKAEAPNGESSVAAADYASELDDALKARDYLALQNRMLGPTSGSHVLQILDWARARMTSGSSVIVPLLYATNLWRVGSPAPQGSEAASLKESAGIVTLYALSVTFVDGQKCLDETAPTHRLERIVIEYQNVLHFFSALPAVRQKVLMTTAVAMESQMAALRGNDDYLCRFGIEQTRDYIRKHGQEGITTIPPRPGDVGPQTLIPSDPTYEPAFLSQDAWKPKQAKMRGQLQILLNGIVAKAANQAP